jgi:hypothetical protein
MKDQPFNLDREFIKWFYEEPYPIDGINRAQHTLGSIDTTIDILDYFMRQAYKQGARAMQNETRCILQDWACAVEGLDPELVTSSEVFDRAEYNLKYYYDQLNGELND